MKSPLIEPLEARIAPAVISITPPTGNPLNEGTAATGNTFFDFTISIPAPVNEAITVDATVVNGGAVLGDDFFVIAGDSVTATKQLTIPAGQTSAVFRVLVNPDNLFELDETFSVQLSGPSGGGAHTISPTAGSATATIKNDELVPQLYIKDAQVEEGNTPDMKVLSFDVRLRDQNNNDVRAYLPISFDWQTIGLPATTATPGVDFIEQALTSATITAGSLGATVTVAVNADQVDELEELLFVKISNALMGVTTLTIQDDTATGRILNDERTVTLSGAPVVVEGNSGELQAQFTATIDQAVPYDVKVKVQVNGDSALVVSGTDFAVPAPFFVTIPANSTSVNFNVAVKGDTLFEATETFTVSIVDVENAVARGASVQGTIVDDDSMPSVSIFAPSSNVTEGSTVGGETDATFRVVLSKGVGVDVTVMVSVADGTATLADGDYDVPGAVPVVIPAGQTQGTFTVKVNHDQTREPNETLLANIVSATNATVAISTAQATIVDDDPLPTVSINDLTMVEGDAGTKTYNFTVTLSNRASENVTFTWGTANGTAQGGTDFVARTGETGTITAGSLTTTLSVTVNADTADEVDEAFFVNISNALLGGVPLNITDAQGAGTIENDDLVVSVERLGAATVAEGDAGNTNVNFRISLPTGVTSAHDVTVTFVVGIPGNTATAGQDYLTPVSLTATIPAGQNFVDVPVAIVGDTIFDGGDETLSVKLLEATNAVIGTDTAAVTITELDAAPVLSIANRQVTEGNSGEKFLTFTVAADRASDSVINFSWGTTGVTAIGGVDYIEVVSQNGAIGATALTTQISVRILGDTVFEADETFTVQLTGAKTNGTDDLNNPSAIGTIQNDESAPRLKITDASTPEGVSGGKMVFTVSLVDASDQPITADTDILFDWATSLGSATPNVDYTAVTNATGTIAALQSSTTIEVNLLNDGDDELSETLLINLANARINTAPNATPITIADGQAVGTIVNDDVAVRVVQDGVITEGNTGTSNAVFKVQLVGGVPSAHDVTATFTLTAGTALQGSDYQNPASFSVLIPAGQTEASFTVPIVGDVINEGAETFTVTLASATNAVVSSTPGDAAVVATINDNDPIPTYTLSDATVEEGDSGTKTVSFFLDLSNPASEDVTFQWSTANGSATAGQDYTAVPVTNVTIAKGQTRATLTVTLTGDTVDEADENFFINVTDVMLGTTALSPTAPGDAQALGTIENDDAVVRISGATITEGSLPSIGFTVSLQQPALNDVTVTLNLTEGTAKAGIDYTVPGTLVVTIPAGQTSALFSVPIIDDALDETTEAFSVTIASAVNAKIGSATATGTINDDDAPPVVSVVDPVGTLLENTGTPQIQFTIRLNAASGQPVSVLVTPQSGSATLGVDFAGAAQTITFAPGETEKLFVLNVTDDAVFEGDETLSVVLSNAIGATIGDATGDATITDNEQQPTVSISNVLLDEGSGSATTAFTFTVSLSNAASQAVTVDLATLADSATAGSDFTALAQTVTIPAGQTQATFTVNVKHDSVFEADEQFFVNGTNARLGTTALVFADAQGVGTIRNDEVQPTISINDVTVLEGNTGTKEIEFTVTLSAVAGADVKFDWATVAGTAISSVSQPGDVIDFVGVSTTTETIAAGETTKRIKVTVNSDALAEADETFSISLTNARYNDSLPLTIVDGTGEAKLLNDDLSLSIADVTAAEGSGGGETDFNFVVTLSGAHDFPVTVHYNTQDGSATSAGAAADFTAIGDTVLTFAPGELTKTITVKVKADANYDIANAFKVVLSQPVNAQISDADATGTITDDDAKPVVTISDVTRVENADGGGTTQFAFQVTLDHASDETVTVNASTLDGTALAGSDYTAITNQQITFAPGETTKTVTVNVLNDAVYEVSQKFNVVLSDASNASLTADFMAEGTIQNDDAVPKLKITSQTVVEGNSGERDVTFTVVRTGDTEEEITFQFATVAGVGDGIATEDVDYVRLDENFTMAPGETTKTVTVKVKGDALDEKNETFAVKLSVPSGGNAEVNPTTDGDATVTILNDDLTVALDNAAVSVAEGSSGQTDLVFRVVPSVISMHDVEVTYTVTAGTATEGTDYVTLPPLKVIIPAGAAFAEIRVPVQGDLTAEDDETVTVTLTGATQAVLGDAEDITSVGTILNDDAALSISDGLVVEGNNGTKQMKFTVTLEDASAFPVTVHYSAAQGTDSGYTAIAGTDFTAVEGDLTFLPGETTKDIFVSITGDTIVEGDEKFLVTLSNPLANGQPVDALKDATADGVINDDDAFLSINDVVLQEGDSGTVTAIFTVTLTPASGFPVTVKLSTVDGTAISTGAAPDFVAKTETITFGANETTKTFSVLINGDRVFESASELFSVVMSDATGAAILDGTGTGTITNSADVAPTVSVSDATVVEGAAGDNRVVEFTVTLSQASDTPVTFDAATAFVTGQADAGDLTPVTGSYIIPAGVKTLKIQVPVIGDGVDEADERFEFNISNAKAGATTLVITDALGIGTILNDDLGVSLDDTSVSEGNPGDSGTTTLAITARVSAVSAHDVTVLVNVAAGTATAGTDFTQPTSQVAITIPAGSLTGTSNITVNRDALDENDETLNFTIASATGARIDDATGVGTILDDDARPTITMEDITVNEGQAAVFKVTLDKVSAKDITLTWVTTGGTATGGDGGAITTTQGDYKQFTTPQTIVIPAGSTSVNISIPTVNDTKDENAEQFGVELTIPADSSVPGSTETKIEKTATIAANDLGIFSISDASVVEGNSGETLMTFTVTRSSSQTGSSAPFELTSTVRYSTNGGSASGATDYVEVENSAANTLTFGPGETTKTITIRVNGDTVSEIDETFFVRLSDATGATISDGTGAVSADGLGTGTIKNDEASFRLELVSGTLTIDEEAAGGAQQFAVFRVVRFADAPGKLSVPATVFYSTVPNDASGAILATAGTDFTTTTGSIQFTAITDSTTTEQVSDTLIRVPITKDTITEGEETFKLKLTSAINASLSSTDSEKVITIHDDDLANLPRVTIADARLEEGASGNPEMVFKLKLVDANGNAATAASAITVKYGTADGTATAGADYIAAAADASVVFTAGLSEREVRVQLIGDAIDEVNETFFLNLLSAEFALPGGTGTPPPVTILDNQAVGTIVNDDLIVSVSTASGQAEGNGTNTRTITVTIPQASTHDVTLKYVTKDGTAESTGLFADFVAVGTATLLTIPAGQTSATFDITVNGDLYAEANEAFTIEFSDVTDAKIDAASFSVSILNDDAQASLSIGDASIVEGDNGQANLVFTVTLAGGTRDVVTVNFATVDGTASSTGALVDFGAVSGLLTFAASPTGGTQTVVVPVFGDTWRELTETFSVQLSNAKLGGSASAVTLVDGTATGTIEDNGDTTLGLTINDVKVVEGNSNTTPSRLTFTIATTAPVTGQDVTFNVFTRNGTAKAAASGGDFTALSNVARTIAVGASSTTVEVTVTGDTAFEQSEFMFLDLRNISTNVSPVGGSGATLSGRGIIFNDDIHVISSRQFEYVDENGDLVNVRITKGSLSIPTTTNSTGDLTFVPTGTVGGRFLQKIDFSNETEPFKFSGTDIIITATPQILVTGEILGDGKANVGAIDAAVPQGSLFQFISGVQLGKVVVPGDLGRIIAGSTVRPAGIRELVVGSLGGGTNLPTSPVGVAANASYVLGPIGKMIVNGDVTGSLSVIGDSFTQPIPTGGIGKIGTLVIKGALKGGTDASSGQIAYTAGIGNATIGSIIGGAGQVSGTLLPMDGRFSTNIGNLTVLGDVVGGSGTNSGLVNANKIGSVTLGKFKVRATDQGIEGNLIGGSGERSGNIFAGSSIGSVAINGDIVGGSGKSSGQIVANTTLGKALIAGDIQGGNKHATDTALNADSAGSLVAGVIKSSVTVQGSLIGGTGAGGGGVLISGITQGFESIPGNVPIITIGKAGVADSGNLKGGAGEASGLIQVDGSVSKLTIYGDLIGTSASATGGAIINGTLGTALIKGSILGGSSADTGSATVFRTGFIDAGNISKITVEGHIQSGNKVGASTNLVKSGSITSSQSIGTLQVLANDGDDALLGTATRAVLISAGSGIGNVTIQGNVALAEILAGFSGANATNPRGTVTNAGASIGTVIVNGQFKASSIVAGVDAGGDNQFGTIDDQQTSGINQNLVSRIASVLLQSVAAGAGPSYGIVAERVDAVKVGGVKLPLMAGPHNDNLPVAVGDTTFRVREI